MNVLISACLLGAACRYDGKSAPLPDPLLERLKHACHLIPVCPEIFGWVSGMEAGAPAPRRAPAREPG